MKLTAEISLYPLNEEYVPVIKSFIRRLRDYDELTIVSNAMSTQVCGEYAPVFDAIASELRHSADEHGKQVLVCKFIVGELDIKNVPDI